MRNLTIALFLALMACTKAETITPTIIFGNKLEATYNTEGEYQQNVKVKITNIEDSRCPKSVTCVWQGSVKVSLTLSQSGVAKEFVLEFLADNSKPATTTVTLGNQKYLVEIADVLPYPQKSSDEIKLKDYKVTLTVKNV